jgi:nucleoside 2-deoxyribosyltransferase
MIIYLCGAINGCSDSICKDWREYTKKELSTIEGIQFLDPMRRDYRGIEANSVKEIIQGDEEDIRQCDIVLAMANIPSWGTAMEIRAAFSEMKKHVITICDSPKPSPWLKGHCSAFYTDLDSALQYIKTIN